MNQRQAQANRQAAKASGRLLGCGPEDDNQEDGSHHHLTHQHCHHVALAGRVLAETVAGKTAHTRHAGLAGGNEVKHARRRNGAQYLSDDLARQLRGREALANDQPNRHGGVKVPT